MWPGWSQPLHRSSCGYSHRDGTSWVELRIRLNNSSNRKSLSRSAWKSWLSWVSTGCWSALHDIGELELVPWSYIATRWSMLAASISLACYGSCCTWTSRADSAARRFIYSSRWRLVMEASRFIRALTSHPCCIAICKCTVLLSNNLFVNDAGKLSLS